MAVKGLFITLEGGEGVGKTTGMQYLEQCLREQGVDLVVTREPGGTRFGERVRNLLLEVQQGSMDDMAELLLIFSARAQHLREVIEPALEQGRWVLCDRFTDATYAYQGAGRHMRDDLIRDLELMVQGSLQPDLTLILDIPVQVGLARASERSAPDRFEQEQIEFFERVRNRYLQIAQDNPQRCVVIDASRSLDGVQSQISDVLENFWESR